MLPAGLRQWLFQDWRAGLAGAGLCLFVGVFCLVGFAMNEHLWRDNNLAQGNPFTYVGGRLGAASYDLPFHFWPGSRVEGARLIYVDPKSEQALNATWPFDRSMHARLIERLTEAGVRAVVLDVVLSEAREAEGDQALADALRRSPNVVLAATLQGGVFLPPHPMFGTNRWGQADFSWESDYCVRRHLLGTSTNPSLAMKLREVLDLHEARSLVPPGSKPGAAAYDRTRWVNYYGRRAIRHSSYSDVLQAATLVEFRGTIVFVGKADLTSFDGRTPGNDFFNTPFGPWPGVDLHATACMNFVRGDWLEEWPEGPQMAWFCLAGILLGYGFARLAAGQAVLAGLMAFVGVAGLEYLLRTRYQLWSPWLILGAVQVPCAVLWAIVADRRRLSRDPQGIPNYELLKMIGRGSYGEVWHARGVAGQYCAMKLVERSRFTDDKPFDRAFRGLQHYSPISLRHPGLLHVLHVGLGVKPKRFYYTMELADATTGASPIEPVSYQPRTLAAELKLKGHLPVDDCLRLGITLAAALEFLHDEAKLIHGDVKPPNIVYVNGRPKLADIDLAAPVAPTVASATSAYTKGYDPPEGPGTKLADIFALGKVLYESGTGKRAREYPDLPDTLPERPDCADYMKLNAIILKACEPSPEKRYATARQLREDLEQLRQRMGGKPPAV